MNGVPPVSALVADTIGGPKLDDVVVGASDTTDGGGTGDTGNGPG
jgi:hypothetical protein